MIVANDLNAQKGTFVASEWKDGIGEGNYTPITPEKLNHIEKGVQSNSEDLKKLGDAWDSVTQKDAMSLVTPSTGFNVVSATLHTFGPLHKIDVTVSATTTRGSSYYGGIFRLDSSIQPASLVEFVGGTCYGTLKPREAAWLRFVSAINVGDTIEVTSGWYA